MRQDRPHLQPLGGDIVHWMFFVPEQRITEDAVLLSPRSVREPYDGDFRPVVPPVEASWVRWDVARVEVLYYVSIGGQCVTAVFVPYDQRTCGLSCGMALFILLEIEIFDIKPIRSQP